MDRKKKMKVVLAAVSHYLEEEKEKELEQKKRPVKLWSALGKKLIMENRRTVQSRGKLNRR